MCQVKLSIKECQIKSKAVNAKWRCLRTWLHRLLKQLASQMAYVISKLDDFLAV